MKREDDYEDKKNDNDNPDQVDTFLDEVVEFGEKPPKTKNGK